MRLLPSLGDLATGIWIGLWLNSTAREVWRLFKLWKRPTQTPFRREERAVILANGKYAHLGIRGCYSEAEAEAEIQRQLH